MLFKVKAGKSNVQFIEISTDMELKATVEFLGDLAHYIVTTESESIYLAHLLHYEGPDGVTPPESVLLVKGVRRWSGSYEESHFIQDLGNAIDNSIMLVNNTAISSTLKE